MALGTERASSPAAAADAPTVESHSPTPPPPTEADQEPPGGDPGRSADTRYLLEARTPPVISLAAGVLALHLGRREVASVAKPRGASTRRRRSGTARLMARVGSRCLPAARQGRAWSAALKAVAARRKAARPRQARGTRKGADDAAVDAMGRARGHSQGGHSGHAVLAAYDRKAKPWMCPGGGAGGTVLGRKRAGESGPGTRRS